MSSTGTVTFSGDIQPVLQGYVDEMAWRFNLASYDDVKANYDAIRSQVTHKGMPPPPYDPFPAEFMAKLVAWGEQGFPP